MVLSSFQFDRTRQLALSLAGIQLVQRHHELLNRRSRRRGISRTEEMEALLRAAETGQTDATQQLLGLLTTKSTRFLRHPQHFALTAKYAAEAARARGRARLWSAGTATGEESYSLAMAMIEAFDPVDPPVSIVATDIDAEALATARRGEYDDASIQTLSAG